MDPEKLITKHAKKSKISSISVGLINKDKTQLFNYGEIKKGSGIAPTSDTIYEIGSMTKTFTAILTVKLQEEGLLSLDDPVTKFLPEFEGSDFDKNKITLYHLITHTSGLVEVPLKEYPKAIIKWVFRLNNGKIFPPLYSYDTSKFLDEVYQIKLKNNPGVTFRYSNTGVGLIGKILEHITGLSYEELIKDRICKPLGMDDTIICISEEQKERLAMGYLYTGKEADPICIPAIESAGNIRSTVSDILKFLNANLGLADSSLLSVLEYCQQNTRIKPKISPLMKLLPRNSYHPKSYEIGLGWVKINYDDIQVMGHNGGTEGFSTLMNMVLDKKTGVVVLTNHALKDSSRLGIDLLRNNSS